MAMSTSQLILFFFSGIGILNSIFFSVYLFLSKRGNLLSNKILAFLLLAFSVRVAKSIFYYLLDGIPIEYINAGLIGKAAIGPLLLLYIQSMSQRNFRLKTTHILHFSLALIFVAITPFLEWQLIVYSYWLTMAQLLIYIVYSFFYLNRFEEKVDNHIHLKSWLRNMLFGVGLVWVAYLSQILMGGVTVYAIGATWFTFVMYSVAYLALKQHKVFSQKPKEEKYQTSHVQSQVLRQHEQRLLRLMSNDDIVTDQNLSLGTLASRLEIRPDVLSRLINEHFEKNFNDFINGYRIKKAQELLLDPIYSQEKVATIAYDCGYNSVSAFNTAFKRIVGQTPSTFRDSPFASRKSA